MQKLQGIAVSPGVAIGEALVMDNEGFRIPRRFVARDAVEEELDRLWAAMEAVAAEIARNRDAVSRELGDKYGAIFEDRMMDLSVNIPLEEALDLGWEIFAECFTPAETGMPSQLLERFWPLNGDGAIEGRVPARVAAGESEAGDTILREAPAEHLDARPRSEAGTSP